MANEVLFGADALSAMEGNEGGEAKFHSFKSGTTLIVKAANMATDGRYAPALMSFYSYGIYKQVNSFVAQNPSVKSKKGYPVENLTSWDKAWKFHSDQSEKFGDAHSQEAGKYRVKQRYAFVFINLEDGQPIILDLSAKQATAVYAIIKKYEKKIDKLAFELSKQGSGSATTVTLSPIMDAEEDLSKEQFKHFNEAKAVVEPKIFEGLLYELSDEDMLRALYFDAKFDVTKIGYDVPTPKETTDGGAQTQPSTTIPEAPEDVF